MITLAVPKGRILKELVPILERAGISPEPAFFDNKYRSLQFKTNHENLSIIRVRSFDVATIVAFGGADIGVAGLDVLMEFDYSDIYSPVDLGIGKCRLSIAQPADNKIDISVAGHIRVATKYPSITKKHFENKGVQAECIKLNGAMELAPKLGLCSTIVDLVSTGGTLKANELEEIDVIAEVTSRLIVNRVSFKTKNAEIKQWIERIDYA